MPSTPARMQPGALRALVRDPGGQPAVRAPGRGRGPGLHRRRRDPLVDDGPGDDDLAAVEQVGSSRGRVAERRGHVRARGSGTAGRLVGRGRLAIRRPAAALVVDVTSSAASSPWYGRSVTTTATGSPTNRTPSRASSGWPICALSMPASAGHVGRSARSAPVNTATTPGRLQRGADVDRQDPRVRDGRPDEVHVAGARPAARLDVVGVDAAGGQEAGIFGPDDPGAQYAHVSRSCLAGRRWSKPGRSAGQRRTRGRKIGYPFCVSDGGVAQSGRASGS